MKTYLHDPTDFAKTLKLRFRVGDLDLPEKRKKYTSNCSSREEEVDAQLDVPVWQSNRGDNSPSGRV